MSTGPACRFCGAPLRQTLVDLGMSPLCESYVAPADLNRMEPFYPLHVYVCGSCLLAQVEEFVSPEEIFTEYAYFSSFADSWLEHAKRFADMAASRFGLGAGSLVVELASNDGYLLQYFVEKGVPVLGIEPARNVARAAVAKGIPTRAEFFGTGLGEKLAAEGRRADLVVGNNVLAQVPGLNDFVRGIKLLLKPGGVATLEFPHLQRLLEGNQFDTIYHEHFSYFSFLAVERVFAAHGLTLFDVEELPTHGGSLRIYARHEEDRTKPVGAAVGRIRENELAAGIDRMSTYEAFAQKVAATKRGILEFLIGVKREGKSVCGYGAPGKGNTLLNYCGIRTDFLDYTVDRNPYKQGKFTPGTHIPIFPPERIRETRPDYVFILPWNFKDEIIEQLRDVRGWGGRFVVPIPDIKVYE
jgi:SAM-dependent methyltransferase